MIGVNVVSSGCMEIVDDYSIMESFLRVPRLVLHARDILRLYDTESDKELGGAKRFLGSPSLGGGLVPSELVQALKDAQKMYTKLVFLRKRSKDYFCDADVMRLKSSRETMLVWKKFLTDEVKAGRLPRN